ncbi:hypothetical protein XELAEV_18040988mg [Xenopus laevis]|uniref:Uncharacterized protein n=1 Tax=Xenopus laevis TaxID=8355 RepID=A0A974C1G3_XENLA|nr:hypothetical protein XELAEV_18040988mg [Xenopus laevis]
MYIMHSSLGNPTNKQFRAVIKLWCQSCSRACDGTREMPERGGYKEQTGGARKVQSVYQAVWQGQQAGILEGGIGNPK